MRWNRLAVPAAAVFLVVGVLAFTDGGEEPGERSLEQVCAALEGSTKQVEEVRLIDLFSKQDIDFVPGPRLYDRIDVLPVSVESIQQPQRGPTVMSISCWNEHAVEPSRNGLVDLRLGVLAVGEDGRTVSLGSEAEGSAVSYYLNAEEPDMLVDKGILDDLVVQLSVDTVAPFICGSLKKKLIATYEDDGVYDDDWRNRTAASLEISCASR